MTTKTTNRKPIEYYLDLAYPITIEAAPEGGFVAAIDELPGCITQGETLTEAYEMVEEARKLWIETTYEDGQDIPLPRDKREYSGKFIVRVPRSLHRELDELAEREGVSLNHFIVSELSRCVGNKKT